MSYESQNDLAVDPEFRGRVRMCVAEQAEDFVMDDRPEYKQLAYQAIAALDSTTDQFVPLVAVRPAMTAASTDGDILAAVQYVWPIIGARYIPAPLPTIPT
jgi:hypothetical protein